MIEFLKTKWKWVVGFIIIILLGLFIARKSMRENFFERLSFIMELGTYTEEAFLPLDIETTNIVRNDTEYSYLDTIVKVGLKEMGLNDSISVIVRPISDEVKQRFDSQMTLEAHIIGRNNQYLLFIDDMSRYEAIKVISHELVHLRQYRSGKFVMGSDYVMWNGKRYSANEIYNMNYEDRPWEREAYTEQRYLNNKLNTILYGK